MDLNSDTVRNYGQGDPFLPYENGDYNVYFLGLFKLDGPPPAYLIKVYVASSNNATVTPGQRAAVYFNCKDQAMQQISAGKLRAALAAIMKADVQDPNFDANTAMATFLSLGERVQQNGLWPFHVQGRNRVTKNGKEVTDFRFQPWTPEQ